MKYKFKYLLVNLFLVYSTHAIETVSLAPFTYHQQSQPGNQTFTHLGSGAYDAIRIDYNDSDWPVSMREHPIEDIVLFNSFGSAHYRDFFCSSPMFRSGYRGFICDYSEFIGNEVYNGAPTGTNIFDTKGVDAYEYNSTHRIHYALCDRGNDRVVFYDHEYGSNWVVHEIVDQTHLRRPKDVAIYNQNNDQYAKWIAVLTFNGDALAVYNIDPYGNTYGQFASSYGLPSFLNSNDGHAGFLSGATSIYSQHSKVYVCDSGHQRILTFTIHVDDGQLVLTNIYDLRGHSGLYGLTGDKNGSIYVTDTDNNEVIKFYGGISSTGTNPLIEIEHFGNDPNGTIHLNHPKAITAIGRYLWITEELGTQTGLVQGIVGGRIKDINVSVSPTNSTNLRIQGLVTGQCNEVQLHKLRILPPPDEPQEEIMTLGSLANPGPLSINDQLRYIDFIETRPFGTYQFWLTWTSETCENPCTAPDENLYLLCGTMNDPNVAPIVTQCNLQYPNNLSICWDPIPGITRYEVFSRTENGIWHSQYSGTASHTLLGIDPGVVFELKVRTYQNGVHGPFSSPNLLACLPITDSPHNLQIMSRSSTSILLGANSAAGSNRTRVYYGTDPNNLVTYKDFRFSDPLILHYQSDEISSHNQIWHFQSAGVVLNASGVLVGEPGPRTNTIVSASLSPTTSGEITWPERWFYEYDPEINVQTLVSVTESGSLTIDPGIQVNIGNSATMKIQGTLTVGSTTGLPVIIHGQSEQFTGVIQTYPSATVSLNRLNLDGGYYGILARGGEVTLRKCNLHGNAHNLVLVRCDALVDSCTLSNSTGHGAVVIRSNPTFVNNIIRDNEKTGILIWSSTYTDLLSNAIYHNGSNEVEWNCGVRMLNGHAHFHCNSIYENNGPGIAMLQGFSDLVGLPGDYPGGRNTINQNCTNEDLSNMGQILMFGTAMASLDYGLNIIKDTRPEVTLVRTINPSVEALPPYPEDPNQLYALSMFWARDNYWGITDQSEILERLPVNSVINPLLTTQLNCNQGGAPTDPHDNPSLELANQGLILEAAGAFEAAKARYDSITKYYPDSKHMPFALDRIEFCDKKLNLTWEEISDYFSDMADTATHHVMKMAAFNTAAWCLVEMGDMETAREKFQELIDISIKNYDVVYNSMGKLMTELEDDDWGSLKTSSKKSDIKNTERTPISDNEYRAKLSSVLSRMDSLLGAQSINASPVNVPSVYALYQNYPNPFNPNTEIKFDVPEASKVELKIYNITGQEVTTLVDEVRTAGVYRVFWDSKNSKGASVASGVYIYQIKAGNFIDAKKMVLLK